MERVTKNLIVTLGYSVTGADGQTVDEGKEPLRYLHGGYEGIFPLIEKALDGKSVGDSVTVTLQPAEAFGEYDPGLVDIVPVAELPQPLSVGMQFEGNKRGGDEDSRFLATVTDIVDGSAVLDGNHPLAGKTLIFNCTVLELRPATAEELASVQSGG